MRSTFLICLGVFFVASGAKAEFECLSRGAALPVDNARVLEMKSGTPNQYHDRAHIEGVLQGVFPDKTGHHHFEVAIGPASSDVIEVIYNEDFGGIPALTAGMSVEACGDYITANAPSGGYPASPDGAIVHWVHRSPNPHHDSGFLVLGGVMCGQDSAHSGPKH